MFFYFSFIIFIIFKLIFFNENNSEVANDNNFSDEALVNLKEKPLPCSVRVYFYFSSGTKLIFKKE